MVFGNMGETSGTGVAFTRDPATGENVFYGEYLMNAQGEDVVAGIRTPVPISQLKADMPEIYAQLESIYKKLEQHYKDMQDIEFTIQEGRLFMLQTRTGKRTGPAAVRMAVEMVEEGLIDEKTAVMRVQPSALDQLLHPMIDPKAKVEVLAKGLPASPGAAVGNRDVACGHRRHARGAGHPDRPRRHDLPRRRGGKGHGQVLRGRLRSSDHQRASAHDDHQRSTVRGGRLDHPQRFHRRSHQGQGSAGSAEPHRQLRQAQSGP